MNKKETKKLQKEIEERNNTCIDCGKLIKPPSRRCRSCYYKYNKGKNHSSYGIKYSEESIRKRIETRKKHGYVTSSETRKKIGIANTGEKNSMWKGDEVGYIALHEWIRNHKPKPKVCESCKKNPPYDLANISGKYKRDISDFEWLCRGCHMKEDGRSNNLNKGCNLNRNEKGQFNPNES